MAGKPPPDEIWMETETRRDVPGAAVVYWLPLLTLLFIAAAFILARG